MNFFSKKLGSESIFFLLPIRSRHRVVLFLNLNFQKIKSKIGCLLTVVFAFFISCSENNIEDAPSKRQLFLEGKSDTQIRSEFVNLSFGDQRELWLDKLNQVQRSDLPKTLKGEIARVRTMLSNAESIEELYRDFGMKQLVLELTQKLTKADFRGIFSDLRDYEQGRFSGGRCLDCKAVIEQQWNSTVLLFEESQNRARTNLESVPTGDELPKCNCDWTCPDGSNGVDCTTRN